MLGEIVTLFERGVLDHLPISTWDVRRAPDAFRFMRESRHVGKIVLRVPQPPDPHGTILITGATGGLGAVIAQHLAEHHGARHLLLTSRSGEAAPGASELKGTLQQLGCEVQIAACDVSDKTQLQTLLSEIPAEHPLTAVLHAAGALDDGVISSLNGERLRTAMVPKVDGALHLHELTKHLPLSQFILFSSIAGTIGSPGQANYAAANAFLDALACDRHAHGLPAHSLAWGTWAKTTGMTAALSETDHARLQRQGIIPFSQAQGLQLIDLARSSDEPLLAPVALDLAVLRAHARAGALAPILSTLIRAPARRAATARGSLANTLKSTPESEWDTTIQALVLTHIAAVLGHTNTDAIAPDRVLKDLGLTSLGSLELARRLTQATDIKLPTTLAFDHPTPTAITTHLRQQAQKATSTTSSIDTDLANLESQLRSLAHGSPARASATTRLQQLLSTLSDTAHSQPGAITAETIRDASDEQVFELIDQLSPGS